MVDKNVNALKNMDFICTQIIFNNSFSFVLFPKLIPTDDLTFKAKKTRLFLKVTDENKIEMGFLSSIICWEAL